MTQQNDNLGGPPVEEINFDDLDMSQIVGDSPAEDVPTDTEDEDPYNTVMFLGNEDGDEGEESDEPEEPLSDGEKPAPVAEAEASPPDDEAPAQPGARFDYEKTTGPLRPPAVEPDLAQQLRQEREALEQQRLDYEIDARLATLSDQYANQLVQEQNWIPEQAKSYADAQAALYGIEIRKKLAEEREKHAAEVQRKEAMAQRVAEYYQVNASDLMDCGSTEQMVNVAERLGRQAFEARKASEREAALRRSRVPAQSYDQPNSRRSGSTDQQLIDRYNNGAPMDDKIRGALRRAGIG